MHSEIGLGGEQPNIADIALAAVFLAGRMAGFEPDARRHPRLAGYLSRLLATPLIGQRSQSEIEYFQAMSASAE